MVWSNIVCASFKCLAIEQLFAATVSVWVDSGTDVSWHSLYSKVAEECCFYFAAAKQWNFQQCRPTLTKAVQPTSSFNNNLFKHILSTLTWWAIHRLLWANIGATNSMLSNGLPPSSTIVLSYVFIDLMKFVSALYCYDLQFADLNFIRIVVKQ